MSVVEMTAETVERSLIGSLVFDRDAIASVADRITVDAFETPTWRAAFGAVMRCWERRVPPDVITVHDELAHDPLYRTDQAWWQGLVDLKGAMEFVVDNGWPCHAPHYADAVVAFARRRALSDAGASLIASASRGDAIDPGMVMHRTLASLDRFGAVAERQGPKVYDEIIPDYQERVMRMRSGEIPNRVTATGFRDLDRKLIGGVYPGELVILAARPSMGKTGLALQMAHNVARAGRTVVVFSAEMSRESLLKRAVAELSGASTDRTEYELSESEFDRYLATLERLRPLPVAIDDTPGITTAQMLVRLQAMQRTQPVGLVVFDYIELAGDQVQTDSEERRINAIVKALKTLARTCDVPVLALCQLNRNVESRSEKRPTLADLRYSGSIEQDADKVMFLYRHDYYVNQGSAKPEPGAEGIAEVIVSKHRNGPTGPIKLHFRQETMTFHAIDYAPTQSRWAH